MKDLLLPLLHLAVTATKLCRPGGVRAVIAENLLLKQQLIVRRRSRQRAPNLRVGDRLLCGFGALFLSPGRIRKVAIGLRPSTLLTFHQALVRGKYRRLFSSSARPKKPGPKGPSESLIRAIVELKSRNPRFGCPRIARIISQTFGVDIDKNVVHRVLAKRSRPAPGGTGPSWLSFVGHTTDSLWSVDLFRCASIVLQSDWVLVVMDQFTRRLVGFGVHRGPVDAPSLCRMCNAAIHGRGAPRHLSTDHDPLFEAHRWTANLRLLEIDEIKTVPHVPLSHPFVERLIGTMRRECLDHVLCWNAGDLERKLADFQAYYNAARSHASLEGYTPLERFSNRPCTTWGGRGTSARTDAGGLMRAYSMDLRERVLLDSDAGMKAADVAAKYRVSGSWVRLLKQRRRETGEVAPRVQRHGRRCMLEPHLHTLAALIAAQPDRTLAELKDALATPASVPTVWRAVRALGLTVKTNGPPVRTRSA